MRSRYAVAGGVAGLAAALLTLTVHAANTITLTPLLPTDYPSPIGIDWLSTSNQLLISTYWNTGKPHNFETVDRFTGAHAQWGAQSGWDDEIYFATVRKGQPGGWVEGDVFSAEGSGLINTQQIARFDASGNLIEADWGILPGETKLKRGGLTFDRFNVPGLNGALVVVASNDYQGGGALPAVGGSTVWKIDSSGSVTKIIDLPASDSSEHREGVAVIPNEPAYGPWAGKILVGKEQSNEVDAIDPTVTPATHVLTNLGHSVEDIWVIPPNSDFYGVDHQEGGDSSSFGRIWTAPASQWAGAKLVGKVLLAEEHGARLWTATWNTVTSAFDIVEVSSGGGVANPTQWEHITFAPAPSTRGGGGGACGGATNPPCKTVTQGGWGAAPHGGNPGAILQANFPAGGFAIGAIGVAPVCAAGLVATEFTFSTQVAVQNFLPQGGPPAALAGGGIVANPTSKVTVLAGQVLALTINVSMSRNGVFQAGLGGFKPFTTGSAAGKTVDQILADADSILGGCATPASLGYSSYSDINDIVDAINNMFD